MAVLGVDFGTSNSAAGVAVNGAPHLIALEPGAPTLPTAVFFPDRGAMRIGSRAVAALTDGDDGRYMQALKSLLGTPLLYEERRFGGRRMSFAHVMPLLGKGTAIRDSFGKGTLPAPNRIFNDLATWQMIPFLYAPETRRAVADLRRGAVDPTPLQRLQSVLEDELGHDLAFAVERGKILCNREGAARIGLGVIEPGLGCELTRAAMEHSLHEELAQIRAAAAEALAQGGVDPAQVTRLVMVGGSSLLHAVRRDLQTLCPGAQIESDNALTAVADGLALAAETAFAE